MIQIHNFLLATKDPSLLLHKQTSHPLSPINSIKSHTHTRTVVISTRDSIPLYKLMIQLQRKHLADTEESMSQNNQILHRATCIHMQNQACSIQITESVYSQPSHTCTQSWYTHRIPCGPPPLTFGLALPGLVAPGLKLGEQLLHLGPAIGVRLTLPSLSRFTCHLLPSLYSNSNSTCERGTQVLPHTYTHWQYYNSAYIL